MKLDGVVWSVLMVVVTIEVDVKKKVTMHNITHTRTSGLLQFLCA